MKNLSIVSRIYVGFAIVLVLLVATSGFSYYSAGLITDSFKSLVNEEFEAERSTSRAKIMFLLARKPEKGLMYADDPILVKTTLDLVDSAKAEVSELKGPFASKYSAEFSAQLDQVIASIQAYRDNFELMMSKEIGPQRIIQTVQVRKAAKEVEDGVDQLLKVLGEKITASQEAAVGAGEAQKIILLVTSGVALLVGMLAALAIGKSVSTPVQKLQTLIHRIQETSDLTLRLKSKETHEIGQISRSFDSLMDRLGQAFNKIMASSQSIDSAVGQVRTSGSQLLKNSNKQTSIADSLNSMAQQASEQLGLSRDSVQQAQSLSSLTKEKTSGAIGSMRQTVSSVKSVAGLVSSTGSMISELNDNSARIGGIIGTIRQIADQTNLLALNAAIEAARAGDQGRGFAVVADEVRKLAEDTSDATQEISTLIGEIQNQIQNAVNMTGEADSQTHQTLELVGQSETELNGLSRESEKLNEVFATISEVLNKQDECMGRVLSGIQEISSASDVNSKSAHSAADLADGLESRVCELKNSVRQFKVSAA